MVKHVLRQDGRVYYGWYIVILTFLILICTASIQTSPAVYMVSMEREFGWSREVVSLAVAVQLVVFGVFGPFAVAFMQRFGIKQVILVSFSLLSAALFLMTLVESAWQFVLLWGGLIGLSTGSVAISLAATVANRWFVAHRGLVMGILTASGSAGQLIFLPLFGSMITMGGWRSICYTTSALTLLMMVLVWLFMQNDPRDLGQRPLGAELSEPMSGRAEHPVRHALLQLRRGLGSIDFWLLAGSFFFCGMTSNGLIGTHFIPASHQHGMTEATAAGLLALMGTMNMIGTTASGWLSDRYNNRWLLFWYYGLRGISLLFLPYALEAGSIVLLLFIIFYGLDWVATVPPTVRLTADLFGREQVGIVFAWIAASHQLGAAAAAYLAGWMQTLFGDYQLAFFSAGFISMAASLMVLQISRGFRREEAGRAV